MSSVQLQVLLQNQISYWPSASNAIIYGFNIRPSAAIRKKAEEEGVEIRLHNIIYKALEELQAAMKGMLAPVYEEVVIGQADVRQIYKVSKIGTIAGCMVMDGKMKRDCKVRLIREGIVIYTGKLGSLRRFDNDVKEVINGYECGMTIENFNDIKVGDIIEGFEDQEVEEQYVIKNRTYGNDNSKRDFTYSSI